MPVALDNNTEINYVRETVRLVRAAVHELTESMLDINEYVYGQVQ